MFRRAIRWFVIAVLTFSLVGPTQQVSASQAPPDDSNHGLPISIETTEDDNQAEEPPASDEDLDNPSLPANNLPGVVVSHVLTGTNESDTHELIELYNNSDTTVDITNWCVEYHQHSGNVRVFCFTAESLGVRIILPARAPVILASDALFNAHENFYRDGALSYRGLGEESGVVLLKNSDGELIDGVAWGDKPSVEGATIAKPERGVALERKSLTPGVFQDSNSNADDFYHTEPRLEYVAGAIYEEFDFCLNLPLVQTSLPTGLYRDEATGSCYEESAVVINECPGMVISEVAANFEVQFIELQNQSNQVVNIAGCRVMTNRSDTDYYSLPDKDIQPYGYEVLYIEDTELTLTKTTSGAVYLLSADGGLEVDSSSYTNLKAASSWARFEADWRQTFNVTPGSANVYEQYLPCEEGYYRSEDTGRCRKLAVEEALAPCPIGKERNPETNRCRNIEASSSTLVPCREGQYRNPETNRCRNIAGTTSSLVPCQPGQYRNPETNRCKKLETPSTLADCGEGRERNPETNRCRNIPVSSIPAADFAAIPVADSPAMVAGWWLFGGTAALVAGYAGWEWRREVYAALRRMALFFTSRGK